MLYRAMISPKVVNSLMCSMCLQLTYPLDTLRLRMAVDPTTRSLRGSARTLLREGSYSAFFRGLGPSLLGEMPHPR